ncbi:MAG: PTS sugar transporter subunit IIA [bacterium]
MIRVVIVTHGEFGSALLGTLQMILGKTEGIVSVSLFSEDSPENLRSKIEKALNQVDPEGQGALILVDMLGGTPFNVGIQLAADRKVQVITGVNLPMLVQAVSHGDGENLETLGQEIQKAARNGVVTSTELFKKQ